MNIFSENADVTQVQHLLPLPEYMLVTGPFTHHSDFFSRLEQCLIRYKIELVQLRLKAINDTAYQEIAKQALTLCHQYHARLICNATPAMAHTVQADGVHLTSQRLHELQARPCLENTIVSAACHNASDIAQANQLKVDCVTLSPVFIPSYQKCINTLGWKNFQTLAKLAACPVFALGGVRLSDMSQAKQAGAHGIAGITCFWGDV